MTKSIYLINPRETYPHYDGTDVLQAWGISNRINLADLTMPTVAALVPPSWSIRLCDERVGPVDIESDAEVIGLTGKSSQFGRMIELSAEFKRRGKLVLIGGPYATLSPDDLRPHADILVRGELEDIAGELFGDIAAGTWKAEYHGGRPDLNASPIPLWDLSRRGTAFAGQVQTSRGCPFECEFCDVIQYLGRKQRWKEPDHVIRELDLLYSRGFRSVFFADDNLTVVRRRARALLEALREWNNDRDAGRVHFSTQVSIDIARDPDLLALCHQAGFGGVFIGIETENEASLAETMKRQNLRVDLAVEVGKVVQAGLLVTCGMIVGFDHDDADIFERQARFISRLPTPLVQLNVLVAPTATPLYARLKAEGRILEDEHTRRTGRRTGSLLETNIIPKSMTRAQLEAGAKWLINQVYSPSAFWQRLEAFAEHCSLGGGTPRATPSLIYRKLADRLSTYGEDEKDLVHRIEQLRKKRPDLDYSILRSLTYYCQARHMFERIGAWDPLLACQSAPRIAA